MVLENRAWTSDAATLTVNADGCPNPGGSGGYCSDDIYPNNGDGVWNYADDGDCVVDIADLTEKINNFDDLVSRLKQRPEAERPEERVSRFAQALESLCLNLVKKKKT